MRILRAKIYKRYYRIHYDIHIECDNTRDYPPDVYAVGGFKQIDQSVLGYKKVYYKVYRNRKNQNIKNQFTADLEFSLIFHNKLRIFFI